MTPGRHQHPKSSQSSRGAAATLTVDSTGLKLCGKGEWLLEKHGTATRRSWRALHLGVDADTGRIVAATLTSKDVDDASQVGPLLDQVAGAVALFTGDGGYDQDRVYDSVAERHPEAAVIVSPRANAVPSDTAETAPTQRDGQLRHIAEHARMSSFRSCDGSRTCANPQSKWISACSRRTNRFPRYPGPASRRPRNKTQRQRHLRNRRGLGRTEWTRLPRISILLDENASHPDRR